MHDLSPVRNLRGGGRASTAIAASVTEQRQAAEIVDGDRVVQLVTSDGGKLRFTASVEDLDQMSVSIDDQLALMVEAAGKLGLER